MVASGRRSAIGGHVGCHWQLERMELVSAIGAMFELVKEVSCVIVVSPSLKYWMKCLSEPLSVPKDILLTKFVDLCRSTLSSPTNTMIVVFNHTVSS